MIKFTVSHIISYSVAGVDDPGLGVSHVITRRNLLGTDKELYFKNQKSQPWYTERLSVICHHEHQVQLHIASSPFQKLVDPEKYSGHNR